MSKEKQDRKAPTKTMIMAGYNLHRARRKSVKYLWKAHECTIAAATEAKAEGDIDTIVEVEHLTGQMLQAAGELETSLALIHQDLIAIMRKAGYADITDEDFKEFGGGGGR